MKIKKRRHMIAAGLVLCLAAGLIWQWDFIGRHVVSAAVGEDTALKRETANPPKTVGVIRPRPLTGANLVTFPGRARAATQATLFFRVSAPLERIHANPGDRVKKGDLLLELDDRDYRRQVRVVESQLKSARANLLKMETGARPEDIKILEANLAAARADLALAEKELTRHEALRRSQAVSEQAYDRARTNVQSLTSRTAALVEQLDRDTKGARKEDIMAARAGIEELEVQLAIARDRLGDTRLTAPFDGVVTRRIPDAHEMVSQGAPVMMLDDIARLEIPVDVPETHVRQIMGLKSGSGFSARFLTTGDRQYPAELTEYSSRADQATGTYEFVFSVRPADGDLIFPGMTAEIRVSSGPGTAAESDRAAGLAVPLQSLMGVAGNSAHVFRVDPETKTAVRQPVVFETLAGIDQVNVISGLSRDDLVVAGGAAFIRQGQVLRFELPVTEGDI